MTPHGALPVHRNELDALYQEAVARLQEQEERAEDALQNLRRLHHLQVQHGCSHFDKQASYSVICLACFTAVL